MRLQGSRSESSSSDGEETPSPKSHTTQLINLTEMQQLSAQEHIGDELTLQQQHQQQLEQQQQLEDLQQQLAQQSVEPSIQKQQPGQPMAQPALSDSQLPVAAGVGSRLLGSSEFSGDQELQLGSSAEYAAEGDVQLLNDDDLLGDEERDLCVNCHQAEENKLSFQLKFTEPEGMMLCCSVV